MSYQVLARKWRPSKFSELIGQEHVVTVLTNALEQQRLHHAYLFTGTRGVGKTTIARIFAKSLNCEIGISSSPCGECGNCVDIEQGRFVDLLEIDAASRTKVDDTREILDNVQYAPSRGRYKVYLIDEVHMLSRSSFNALLKTLEEPPEHVKFILATTDPQKLPITVLSRCLQFHLKALTVKQIETKNHEILDAEGVSVEAGCLNLLAKAACGSMRDCLSLTDQSIAQGQGTITLSNTQQMLGGVDRNWVYKILISLIKQDSKELMSLSLTIASYAPNYSRLTAELIQLLHQVAMVQIVGNHFDLSPQENELLEKFSQNISPEDVQLYYQIVLNTRKDLPYVSDEQAGFDMMLLRLLAFKPVANQTDWQRSSAANATVVNLELSEENNLTSNEKSINEFETSVVAKDGNDDLASSRVNNEALTSEESFDENSLVSEELFEQQAEIEKRAEEQNVSIWQVDNQNFNKPEPPAQITNESINNKTPIVEQPEISQNTLEKNSSDETSYQTLNDNRKNLEPSEAEYVENSASLESTSQLETTKNPITSPEKVHEHEPIKGTETSQVTSRAEPQPDFSSPIQSALATRNMLRSRKKQLESSEKKSDDALSRHETKQDEPDVQSIKNKAKPDVPELETLPDQAFDIKSIDPAKIRSANQVDKWANMIDAMALGGRLRQLAIHSTVCATSTDDALILNLDQATKHLISDVAHKQLQANISELLERKITVELNIVEETCADPFKIQSDINNKRFEYVKQLLVDDEIIQQLQAHFQAELDENSIRTL